MKRLIILLAASTAMAGCATNSAPVETAAADQPMLADVQTPAEPAGKPELGTFGFDAKGMDTSVRPGDNFYQYANGTWAKNTQIPADKSNYGMFTMLDDLSKERTQEILKEADPNSKIGAAYASYLDEAAVEAKGLAPFQPWLDQVKASLSALWASSPASTPRSPSEEGASM